MSDFGSCSCKNPADTQQVSASGAERRISVQSIKFKWSVTYLEMYLDMYEFKALVRLCNIAIYTTVIPDVRFRSEMLKNV